MVKDYSLEISESAEELLSIERKESNGKIRPRLQLLRILKEKRVDTMDEGCQWVGISISSGARTIKKYRTGGLEEVSRLYYKGKPVSIGQEGEDKLLKETAKGEMSQLSEVQSWILSEFGKEYSLSGVWVMCRRLKIKLKTGRQSHQKKTR